MRPAAKLEEEAAEDLGREGKFVPPTPLGMEQSPLELEGKEGDNDRPRGTYPDGLLDPHSIPNRPWQDVAVDFVTGLPVSER
eukprot:gene34339-biopygen26182